MICKISLGRLATLMAAGAAIAFLPPAFLSPVMAQSVWPDKPAAEAQSESAEAAEASDADGSDDVMKGIDLSKLDWSQLNIDSMTFAAGPAPRARSAARSQGGSDPSWSNNKKGNGASDVSVKQSVSPFWDTRVGADMTVTSQATTMSELLSEKAANGGSQPQSGGSAWAAITAPGAGAIWDKTAVEARVDPGQDQSKLGTSISKSVPLNEQYSLTLQNGYNVTQQGTIIPVPGSAGRTTRSSEIDQSARLSIGDTGTSVTAGQSLSSNDDKWLRKVGAEQKLLDGVTVSGSVGETAQGTVSKSISAGFKRSW